MPDEPEELTEARELLEKFEAQMRKPEGVVHLSEALSLLADVRAGTDSERIAQIASNVALAYARKVQSEVELLLSREPAVHWEIVNHWQNVFSEFEHSGFPVPQEVANTRSKLVMTKWDREIALMSPTEKEKFLERLESRLQWRVAVEDEETTAVFEPAAAGKGKAVFVCAHGAGSDMNHRSMLQLSQVLRERGFDVVRFNFLYRQKGSRRPDPMPLLKACLAAVVARTRQEFDVKRLVIGGRSMGGRVASMLAAEGFECAGLLLLAYPLHPPGKPEKLRDAHLPQIRVPVLCINGTRDALCRRDLMEHALSTVKTPWQMHWLEGKDHSFPVTEEIGEVAARWLQQV